MPKFIARIGGKDFATNPYYCDNYYTRGRGPLQKGTNFQCVHWALLRTQEIAEGLTTYFTTNGETKDICLGNKPMFNRAGIGNGNEWYRDALWPKSVDNPRVGDIVCYGDSWGKIGGIGYGHVRIIEKIEGNYMYMSGANENLNGGVKFNIKAPITVGGGENASGLQGYIHNPHIDIHTDTTDYKKLYEEAQAKLDKIKELL